MPKTDKALSDYFGVPELASFDIDEDDDPGVAESATNAAESAALVVQEPGALVVTDTPVAIDSDTEFVKDKLKRLLAKGEKAVDDLLEIARAEERASHYEALGGMINQLSNVAMGILEAEGKRQKLKAGLNQEGGGTVNNTQINAEQVVFTGTTADLQAALAKKGPVIDVQATEVEDEEDE